MDPTADSDPFVPSVLDVPSGSVAVTAAESTGTESTASEPPEPGLPRRPRRWVPLVLFLATCGTTFLVGVQMFPAGEQVGHRIVTLDWNATLLNAAAYSASVMFILFAHEMGHFLQAVRYRVPASLPYFIPVPLPPFGTMGAVIVQGGENTDRRVLFDIAISGPIAGLIVALPVLYLGVLDVETMPRPVGQGGLVFGDPLILTWMAESVHGPLAEGRDYVINPLLFAGWVGLFITSLNLVPIGQLDGGHVLYAMIGRRAHVVAYVLIAGAFAFMIWTGYYAFTLLLVLLIVMGPKHPPTGNDRVPLGRVRYVLGWLALAFIFIGFTPMPITQG